MAERLDFKIQFDDKQAQKVIDSLSGGVKNLDDNLGAVSADMPTRSVDSLSGSLKAAALAAGAVVAAIAGSKAIASVVSAASKQEDAVNALSTALKVSGENTEGALDSMEDFASQLQKVTNVGDETTLRMLALSKAYGATNDQAKLIVQASVELAAATGQDLQSAVRQVSKTLGGFAGELGEVNPRIKALTKEQLSAGEAAKLLIAQYGGTAAETVKTFSGRLDQVKNSYGDLLEVIGFNIIESGQFKEILVTVRDILDDLTAELKGATKGLDGLEDSANRTGKTVSPLVGFIGDATLQTIAWASATTKFAQAIIFVPEVIADAFDAPREILADVASLILLVQEQIAKYIIKNEDLVKSIQANREEVDKWGKSQNAIARGLTETREAAEKLEKGLDFLGETVATRFEQMKNRLADTAKTTEQEMAKATTAIQQTFDDAETRVISFAEYMAKARPTVEVVFTDPLFGIKEGQIVVDIVHAGPDPKEYFAEIARQRHTQLLREIAIINSINTSLDIAGHLTANIGQGAEGAANFVKAMVGEIEIMGFSIGKILAPLVDLAQKSEEEIKQTVDEFVEGFEIVIDAIAENIDVIFIAVAKASAKMGVILANGIIEAIAKGVDTLTDGVKDAFLSVVNTVRRALGLKPISDSSTTSGPATPQFINDAQREQAILDGLVPRSELNGPGFAPSDTTLPSFAESDRQVSQVIDRLMRGVDRVGGGRPVRDTPSIVDTPATNLVPVAAPEPRQVFTQPVYSQPQDSFSSFETLQLLRDIKVNLELIFKKDTNVAVELDGRVLAETLNDLKKQGLAF